MANLLFFLITISIFSFVSSVIINGFYKATRGFWKTKADGRVVKAGYILKGWYFFWYQETGKKKIYYNNASLIRLVKQFQQVTGITQMEFDRPNAPTCFFTLPEFSSFKLTLETNYNVCIQQDYVDGKLKCWIFEEEPVYKYPCWLREVLAGCITCFSSFYGTLLFSIFHLMMGGDVYDEMYSAFTYPHLATAFCWMGYVLALAYVNTLLNKKLN